MSRRRQTLSALLLPHSSRSRTLIDITGYSEIHDVRYICAWITAYHLFRVRYGMNWWVRQGFPLLDASADVCSALTTGARGESHGLPICGGGKVLVSG
ncbi:hypothetical protein BC629DRAFT_1131444 [Irpex lacteus]|nr:hypothetical protein BC629DRAFT_1131444 [Irpex lacteus]